MLEKLLEEAIEQKSSDLHFEIYQNYFRVRFRIDGLLKNIYQGPPNLWPQLASKIKVLANLNIAEKRLPQDGKFKFSFQENTFDCRVGICPTVFGEKIAIRLLKNQEQALSLEQIGLSKQSLTLLKKKLTTQGLIIISGPTGSGKTTTLYAILNFLNQEGLNISSVEDPVEININGVNQVSINPNIGLDFATVLKSFLRQDPDVIMVGEIRDTMTAKVAIQAAYTGHLVLATLHTAFAPHAIMRLLDLKVPAINVADTLKLVIAQRLFRKICPFCEGKGNCLECNQGYNGRFALAEFFNIEEDFKPLILEQPNIQKFKHYQKLKNYPTLYQLAKQQVQLGITNDIELERVLGLED